MAHLYFTRHGQTVWNVENKICGATDIGLTDKGREQAKQLGERILMEKLHIDEILYSPLIRARDTALIISEVTDIPTKEEIRLTEQCFGRFEGTARNGEEFQRAKLNFIDSYNGGETMLQLAHRIYSLLDEITAERDKVYLLTAHNGISRVIHSYFNDMTNEEYGSFGMGNCDILKYEF